jgi:hypothetical protein
MYVVELVKATNIPQLFFAPFMHAIHMCLYKHERILDPNYTAKLP